MKLSILLLVIFSFNMSYAGGFQYPNVEFTYAKLYFLNLNLDRPDHIDYHVYKDGVYAQSKLGNGTLLSDEFHAKVARIFSKGIDELNIGLSKCFLPRHGIIYYDKDHNPVASLTICFECDKINVWSMNAYNLREDFKVSNLKKAEQQIFDLAEIVISESIPAYKSQDEAEKYWPFVMSSIKHDTTEYRSYLKVEKFPWNGDVNLKAVESWIKPSSYDKIKAKNDTLIVSNGDSTFYNVYSYKTTSQFLFFENQLKDATIKTNDIKLPFSMNIGMSSDELDNLLNLGYSLSRKSPNQIHIRYNDWNVELEFLHETLHTIHLHNNLFK